jgi:hypothetical protein
MNNGITTVFNAYEVLLPSTSDPDNSIGIYVGDPDVIRAWVTVTKGEDTYVKLRKVDVYIITPEVVRAAKKRIVKVEMEPKIYQAFTRTDDGEEISVGFFTGDTDLIKEWVMESCGVLYVSISVVGLRVLEVTKENLAELINVKAVLRDAQDHLEKLMGVK